MVPVLGSLLFFILFYKFIILLFSFFSIFLSFPYFFLFFLLSLFLSFPLPFHFDILISSASHRRCLLKKKKAPQKIT